MSDVAGIAAALDAAPIPRGRPVVVLVGGADGMADSDLDELGTVLRAGVLPVLDAHAATVVDGGTDSGVMRAIGHARSAAAAGFALVGVAAEGTTAFPGREPTGPDAAELERNHTHVLLVPGESWGDESRWIGVVADVAAGALPSVTVLANGGELAYQDVFDSLARRRPVVVLAGTGRTADVIAGASAGRPTDPRATAIAASSLTTVVPVDDIEGVRKTLTEALTHPSRTTLW